MYPAWNVYPQTDVIVNSAFKNVWRRGQISNAILQKAGHEMEHELNTTAMHGNLIITKSYKLRCKEVYHIVCADSTSTITDRV